MRIAQTFNGQEALTETVENIKKEVIASKNSGRSVLTLEAMKLVGKVQSTNINLSIANAGETDCQIVLGTPLGIADEFESIPNYTSIPNIMFDNLATMSDNQGAGLLFLQQLNKRFVRNAVLVSYIEVIVPNNATGNSQKSQSPQLISIPYNSASDSSVESGLYNAAFTEYTGVSILTKGYVLSDFTGIIYNIVAASGTIKMNIHIAAVDSPVFVCK